MLKGLYTLSPDFFPKIYGEVEQDAIGQLVDIYAPPQSASDIESNLSMLQDADVLFSGWYGPRMDRAFLDAAKNLKMVFYGGGSIREILTEEFWQRNIRITSAYAANAIPVAEYTLAQVILCLKRGWYYGIQGKLQKKYIEQFPMQGMYGSTVGLISLSAIARYLCKLLKPFDVSILIYDPYVDDETMMQYNATKTSLEDIFSQSDVVSLHTPLLEETKGMIRAKHFATMKKNASFINSARGAIVNEMEMIEVLQRRQDIQAVLDVTWPEPPKEESLLFELPNVVITPHIAGAMENECRRMGSYMVSELERYVSSKTLQWEITQQSARLMA